MIYNRMYKIIKIPLQFVQMLDIINVSIFNNIPTVLIPIIYNFFK